MAIMDQLLETVTEDAPMRELRVGPRCVALWSRGLGLAYHFRPGPDDTPPPRAALPPKMRDATTLEITRWARSQDPLCAAVGVAAVNALLRPPAHLLQQGDAYQLIASQGSGKEVTVVGHFPFVDRLRAEVRRLNVLELNPQPGDLPASQAPEVIPRSDVVAITGATLVNHTMDQLLRLAAGRFVVVVGPTSVLSPVLFDHGVSAICGAQVTDAVEVLRALGEGENLRHNRGIRKVLWTAGGRR